MTLELTAKQTEIVAAAQSFSRGPLMLALRSVEDSELASSDTGSFLISGTTSGRKGSVRMIRYGKVKDIQPKQQGEGGGASAGGPSGAN